MSLNLTLIASYGIEVVGDITFRGKCAVEDADLITFRNELERLYPQYAAVMLHPKNEGARYGWQADADKMKGALNTGASDIIVPGFPTLVIELKRQDRTLSDITVNQLEYLQACQQNGCWCCVALGWRAALEFVHQWHEENYLKSLLQ